MQLNPVGKTMDYFQAKQILENDEKFKEDYQKIKKIADRFYRNLNEDVLSKTGLDKLKDYAEIYYHCNTDADRKRWSIGHFTVRKGDFDKYLTRSINTLFHVMVEKLQIDALGELFQKELIHKVIFIMKIEIKRTLCHACTFNNLIYRCGVYTVFCK